MIESDVLQQRITKFKAKLSELGFIISKTTVTHDRIAHLSNYNGHHVEIVTIPAYSKRQSDDRINVFIDEPNGRTTSYFCMKPHEALEKLQNFFKLPSD